MTVVNRSIRGTLDASSGENSSHSVGIITRIVDTIFTYLHSNSTLPSAQAISQSGYLSILTMRDGTQGSINATPTNFTGSAPNGSLPVGHGINLVDQEKLTPPSSNSTPFGFGQANQTFGSGNQGFRHYAHTVQFGKGVSQNTLIGLPNQNNVGFLSGGTNLPAAFGSNLFFSSNAYKAVNIKMSQFHSLTKNDPSNVLGYINNDGFDEETSSPSEVGPISIGNAANGPI